VGASPSHKITHLDDASSSVSRWGHHRFSHNFPHFSGSCAFAPRGRERTEKAPKHHPNGNEMASAAARPFAMLARISSSGVQRTMTSPRPVQPFWIEAAGADAFGHAMPLHTPKLETNEEFVVVRSKRRPVIVVCPPPQAPQVHGIRGGGRVYRRLAMVVPVYSLMSRHTGQLKYDPGFVEQLRILAYPEFLYLPPHPGILPYPSVARLAELQAVYEPHLDPRDLRLADEALRLFQDQLLFRVNGRYGGYLELYREQLMNP